jgi:carboxypeptidase Q
MLPRKYYLSKPSSNTNPHYSNNVLAQTKYGDPSSVLVIGAHSDSVEAGPGVNDDGSGLSSILEIAKLLASYRVRNSVRFGWWSGEESGKLGSTYYVTHLPKAEQKKIKLYLNFDMMASPNYEYGIFDGHGGDFNYTTPMGSGDIEELFIDYFASRDLNYTTIALNGRSDYAPFQDAGIPVGGLATGAEVNKTKAGVEEFGGWEGKPFDQNYHGPGDTVANLNMTAFLVNTQAIGHAVATYARSFSGVGFNETVEDEEAEKRRKDVVRRATTSMNLKKGKNLGMRKKTWQSRRDDRKFYV